MTPREKTTSRKYQTLRDLIWVTALPWHAELLWSRQDTTSALDEHELFISELFDVISLFHEGDMQQHFSHFCNSTQVEADHGLKCCMGGAIDQSTHRRPTNDFGEHLFEGTSSARSFGFWFTIS